MTSVGPEAALRLLRNDRDLHAALDTTHCASRFAQHMS